MGSAHVFPVLPSAIFSLPPSLCSNKESSGARDCQQIPAQRQEHGLISEVRFPLALIHPEAIAGGP